MKVGFDISQIAHGGGVATYTQNLAKELSQNPDLEMVYFYASLRKPYQGQLKNVKLYPFPASLYEFLFNRLRFVPIESFTGKLDIFHSSDWTQPKSNAKKITTYHDVVPLKFPEWSHPKIVEVHKRRLSIVEKEIDFVIAVSESTKKDLIEISKIPAEKITVIYEGPTDDFSAPSETEAREFKAKYKLPDQFVLAMGGVGERKNLKRIKEACSGINLAVAGEDLPRLSNKELNLLYASAYMLVYTSLYEGFGIPILDAFANGLPVLTSSVSSMPEAGGDAALYADPYNVEDIRQKIKMLAGDEDLRKELIKKGFERIKQFSWKKTAQETAALYEKLSGS